MKTLPGNFAGDLTSKTLYLGRRIGNAVDNVDPLLVDRRIGYALEPCGLSRKPMYGVCAEVTEKFMQKSDGLFGCSGSFRSQLDIFTQGFDKFFFLDVTDADNVKGIVLQFLFYELVELAVVFKFSGGPFESALVQRIRKRKRKPDLYRFGFCVGIFINPKIKLLRGMGP